MPKAAAEALVEYSLDPLPDLTLDNLRDIAQGKIPAPVNAFMDDEDQEPEMCPYRELDKEAGDWVYCSLPPHDRKVKHVPGRRESV